MDFKIFLMWLQYLKSICFSQSTMKLCALSVLICPPSPFLCGTIIHLITHFATQLLIILFYKQSFIKVVKCREMDYFAIFHHTVYRFMCQLR